MILYDNNSFQIVPESMAPGSKSKSNPPKQKSKREVRKVDKESNQNLKMSWVKMVEQRDQKRKKEQNKKKAQTFRNKKKVESETKGKK